MILKSSQRWPQATVYSSTGDELIVTVAAAAAVVAVALGTSEGGGEGVTVHVSRRTREDGKRCTLHTGRQKMARNPVSSSWLSQPKLYHVCPTFTSDM
jgi:hypothetical protein